MQCAIPPVSCAAGPDRPRCATRAHDVRKKDMVWRQIVAAVSNMSATMMKVLRMGSKKRLEVLGWLGADAPPRDAPPREAPPCGIVWREWAEWAAPRNVAVPCHCGRAASVAGS